MSTTDDRYLQMAITDVEAPHLSKSPDELRDVAEQLIERGYSEASVAGLVGWLVLKAAGRRDRTAATTRARYRKMLAELERTPKRPNIVGQAGTMLILVLAVPAMVGVSLLSRRQRFSLAQQVYITLIVGADLLIVVVVVEEPAVSREIVEAPSAEIHTLSAHRRPDVRNVCAYPKAA